MAQEILFGSKFSCFMNRSAAVSESRCSLQLLQNDACNYGSYRFRNGKDFNLAASETRHE